MYLFYQATKFRQRQAKVSFGIFIHYNITVPKSSHQTDALWLHLRYTLHVESNSPLWVRKGVSELLFNRAAQPDSHIINTHLCLCNSYSPLASIKYSSRNCRKHHQDGFYETNFPLPTMCLQCIVSDNEPPMSWSLCQHSISRE